jgi:hypothetical protein
MRVDRENEPQYWRRRAREALASAALADDDDKVRAALIEIGRFYERLATLSAYGSSGKALPK